MSPRQWLLPILFDTIYQGCTNPERQGAVTTKFCRIARNICGSSGRNLIHVIFFGTWNFKVCATLLQKFSTAAV